MLTIDYRQSGRGIVDIDFFGQDLGFDSWEIPEVGLFFDDIDYRYQVEEANGDITIEDGVFGIRYFDKTDLSQHSTTTLYGEAFVQGVDLDVQIFADLPEMPNPGDYLNAGIYGSLQAAWDAYDDWNDAVTEWDAAVRAAVPSHVVMDRPDGFSVELEWRDDISLGDVLGDIEGFFGLLNKNDFGHDYYAAEDTAFTTTTDAYEVFGSRHDDAFLAPPKDGTIIQGRLGDDTITAAANDGTFDGGKGDDVFVVWGSRDEYDIRDKKNGDSIFTHDDGHEYTVRNFEEVEFGFKFNPDNITIKPLLREAANWANISYRDSVPEKEGYYTVHAGELGMATADEDGAWSFRNGVFEAKVQGIAGGAVAHVVQVDQTGGDNTLIIAFRGTDGVSDAFSGWGPQAYGTHYAAFAPLIDGLATYLSGEFAPEKVIVTGHSLGGMMVQFMLDEARFQDGGGTEYFGVTFGSPGTAFGGDFDTRMIHVEHSDDLVVGAGDLAGFDTAGERLVIPMNDPTKPLENGPLDEHAMALYHESIIQLEQVKQTRGLFAKESFAPGEETHMVAGDNAVDHLRGDRGAGTDTFGETFFGRGGNDTIEGFSGEDTLYGNAGADSLLGGAARDELRGGGGNDTLNGGGEKDVIYGGGGNDTFIYESWTQSRAGISKRDVIKDMDSGDRFDLRGMDADLTEAGSQSFTFTDDPEVFDTGMLRIVDDGGRYRVQGNVDADAAADFEIVVVGDILLDSSDFLL